RPSLWSAAPFRDALAVPLHSDQSPRARAARGFEVAERGLTVALLLDWIKVKRPDSPAMASRGQWKGATKAGLARLSGSFRANCDRSIMAAALCPISDICRDEMLGNATIIPKCCPRDTDSISALKYKRSIKKEGCSDEEVSFGYSGFRHAGIACN